MTNLAPSSDQSVHGAHRHPCSIAITSNVPRGPALVVEQSSLGGFPLEWVDEVTVPQRPHIGVLLQGEVICDSFDGGTSVQQVSQRVTHIEVRSPGRTVAMSLTRSFSIQAFQIP